LQSRCCCAERSEKKKSNGNDRTVGRERNFSLTINKPLRAWATAQNQSSAKAFFCTPPSKFKANADSRKSRHGCVIARAFTLGSKYWHI
jgi:hypothetical protein